MPASGSRPESPDDPASVQIVASSDSRFEVRGALTFATARRAMQGGDKAFAASAARELEVSCAGVRAADSAGLAVLMGWLGWARRHGRVLRLTDLPEAIKGIARISEVEGLLQNPAPAQEGRS